MTTEIPSAPPEPSAELTAVLTDAPEVALGANAPLPLVGGGTAWWVTAGTVEVFLVPDGGRGARTHVATVGAGGLLAGGPPSDGDAASALLAVGHPETRLRRLDADRLDRLSREPASAAILANALDGWIVALTAELGTPPPPKVFRELAAGEETAAGEEGATFRGREGVVWAQREEGELQWLGRPELPLEEDLPYPVGQRTWLAASPDARASARGTRDLLATGWGDGKLLRRGLDHFHRLHLRLGRLDIERREELGRRRIDRQVELDRRTLETAYRRLASVFHHEEPALHNVQEVADPLLAACRRVGEAQGIDIRPPVASGGRGKASSGLQRIASASRVRLRRVILRDGWWRHDNGPLVGFRPATEDGRPSRAVALLPTSPRSYQMIDPEEPLPVPVDAEVSDDLEGDAYMFYPPLPERPLTPRDLVGVILRAGRSDLLTVLAMGIAGGLLALLVPVVTGLLFGEVIPGADRSQLAQLTLALLVSGFAAAAFQITRSIAVLRLGARMDGALQAAVWDRLLALPVDFFRRFTVGDLAGRSLGIDAIRELLTGNVLTSLLEAFFSLFSFALLFYYSPRLALMSSLIMVLLLGLTAALTALRIGHLRRQLHLQGKIASLLFGLIHGLPKLRVAHAEGRAFARWAQSFAENRKNAIRARRLTNIQVVLGSVYGILASLAIFAMVGLSAGEPMPIGDFLAFNAAFTQFLTANLSMIGVFSSLMLVVPIYERLSPILEAAPEADPSKVDPGELRGELELSHVAFRYRPDAPLVLDDISIRARAGEFIALVGPSGSGKSTSLRLILGFERPEAGSIYFDGQDLAALDLQSVRRQIGVVLQTGQPMAGDIFTNIVGGSNLTLDDAWEAAEMAGLAEDIRAMPMGMHTLVSEGAGTFSGGQRQRLLIARAIVHRPRILLFDEATSALDNRTQEVVSHSLRRLEATRIVIAHRLSTIQGADRIYVIEKGRVTEQGPYEELLRSRGPFSRLAARQIV